MKKLDEVIEELIVVLILVAIVFTLAYLKLNNQY